MGKYYYAFLITVLLISCKPSTDNNVVKVNFPGETQGTYYAITYYDPEGRNFKKEVDSILSGYDQSVSLYVPGSVISRINRNEDHVKLDKYFMDNFNKAMKISSATNGAFDITVGPLVNAWGFGLEHKANISYRLIDSIQEFIGYQMIRLNNNRIEKLDPRIKIDFNAIAQGYAVDVLAGFLESKGILNYLIDIGGEVLAKGTKENNESWKVGIQVPTQDKYGEIEADVVVDLKDKALATSGNYRKYYEEDSIRYSHTINPKTGYPVKHSLLSVSVLADDCATADAFATAFMVMGIDSAKVLLNNLRNLDAYFIFSEGNKMNSYATKGIESIISK
ncbi:FAD:protein FMN transferase [candidate division KSB1 bacterium]